MEYQKLLMASMSPLLDGISILSADMYDKVSEPMIDFFCAGILTPRYKEDEPVVTSARISAGALKSEEKRVLARIGTEFYRLGIASYESMKKEIGRAPNLVEISDAVDFVAGRFGKSDYCPAPMALLLKTDELE